MMPAMAPPETPLDESLSLDEALLAAFVVDELVVRAEDEVRDEDEDEAIALLVSAAAEDEVAARAAVVVRADVVVTRAAVVVRAVVVGTTAVVVAGIAAVSLTAMRKSEVRRGSTKGFRVAARRAPSRRRVDSRGLEGDAGTGL